MSADTEQYVVEVRDPRTGARHLVGPETGPRDTAAVAALMQMKGWEISIERLLPADSMGTAWTEDGEAQP